MNILVPSSYAKTPEELCEEGDANSCFVQASVLFGKSQLEGALVFYEKACTGGHVDGCFFLGHRAESNSKERAVALQKLREMCDQKKYAACTHLGNISIRDNDKNKGIDSLKEACAHGEMKGCNSLGYHAKKSGDMKTAKEAFKKACDQNHPKACQSLKEMR
ncbi:MAG: hypothetical protein K8I00_02345 [Candidatus Omnitrophica bacterium]|nr:hypothetical protein [Candidatus Omnitrophota bacterium]